MSEQEMISPLLDHLQYVGPLSSHDGTTCFLVRHEKLCKTFVVKRISIPQSEENTAALLLTGAFSDPQSAHAYYRDLAEGIRHQLSLLAGIADAPNLAPALGCQIVPKASGVGYDVYILTEQWESLAALAPEQRLTKLDAINMGIDICEALCSLRQAGLIAEDIKPENIYRNAQGKFLLGDLGFVEQSELAFSSLPPQYRSRFTPPEFSDMLARPNPTMDTYALGMVLHWLFSGCPDTAPESLQAPEYCDYELADLILKACSVNPDERFRNPEDMRQGLLFYLRSSGVTNEPILPPQPEESSVEEIPVEEESEETSAEEIPVEEKPEESPVEETPVEEEPVESPVEDAPVEEEPEGSPVEETPAEEESEESPVEDTPVEGKTEESSVEEAPVEEESEEVSVEEALVEEKPSEVPIEGPLVENEPEKTPESSTEEDAALERAVQELLSTAQEEPESTLHFSLPSDEELADSPSHSEKHIDFLEDPAEAPEKPEKVKKKKKKKPIILLSVALVLAALLLGGYLFLWKWYFVEVDQIELVDKGYNYLTIAVHSNISDPASVLLATCKDDTGATFSGTADGSRFTFTGLSSNTRYTISIASTDQHKLTHSSADLLSVTTYEASEIASLSAHCGEKEGTAEITVEQSAGLVPTEYLLTYAAEGETEKTVRFSGSTYLLTGLQVGKTYDLRLTDYDTYYMVGQYTTQFTPVPLTLAENLHVTNIADSSITVAWDCTANPPTSWTVSCTNDKGYSQTLNVTDCSAVFTDAAIDTEYTITVSADTMYHALSTVLDANPIVVKNLQATATADTITVTWDSLGGVPEAGWQVEYSIDTADGTPKLATAEGTSITLTNCVPEADYTITLKTDAWRTTLGELTTHVKTAEAEAFDQYGVSAENVITGLYTCPSNADWTYRDLAERRDSYAPGEAVAYALQILTDAQSSDDSIVITAVIRDADYHVLRVYSSEPNAPTTWNKMWTLSRYVEEVTAPDTPGTYRICVYLNGKLLQTITLPVV